MAAKKHKSKHTQGRPQRRWFLGRRTAIVIAAILVSGLAIGETYIQLVGPKATTVPGWIIDGDQLQNLVDYLPSSLASTYFNTKDTVVLKNFAGSGSPLPTGWRSQAGNHYTSFSTHGCAAGCVSLQRDLAKGNLKGRAKPVALYDDEHWARTPTPEQTNPCGTMKQFVDTAHQQGLTTILAPDQNLAQPGVITSYQGGESENWQTYLRLGLGSCVAKTGSEEYHVMSQPFEAHWCSHLFRKCQSSEADFDNFVTQAALQAKAMDPNIKISAGFSTNPQYFGYFRGAETLAAIMYRDYADVEREINTVWLNVVGRNADTTALYFLSMLGKHPHTQRRSSVLFLQDNQSLQNTQPTADQANMFALNNKGSGILFTTPQTLAGGTSLPAGAGEFQLWTDGMSNQSANISIKFGYCIGNGCTHPDTVKALSLRVNGNAKGAAMPAGAFTTHTATTLPKGHAYHLFVQVTVESGTNFNLLYGSNGAATNLATPMLLPFK